MASLQRDEDIYVNRPDRVERYRVYRNRMVAAIIDGDEELAVLATRRCTAIVTDWIHEDLRSREDNQQKQGKQRKKRSAEAG